MKGWHTTMLQSYLDEFLWWEQRGKTASDAFNHIIEYIATQYLGR